MRNAEGGLLTQVRRRKAFRIVVIVIFAAGALLATGRYLAERAAKRATNALAESLTQDSDLSLALRGGWGQFLLEGGGSDQPVQVLPGESLAALLDANASHVKGEALLDAYRKDPQKFKRYAKVCDTWFHAAMLNSAAQHLPAEVPLPPTSALVTTVDPQYRLDAWGHTFCMFRGTAQTAIVSAGPEAGGFRSCKQIGLTNAQLDHMAVLPITRQQSGALVMVFKRRTNASAGQPSHPD